VTLDAMKADSAAYQKRRAELDDELKNRPTNPIKDPEQLKRDAAKFSSDYQIYKRGGGELSTRDYIMQRAASTKNPLSDDLKRQLQENYGLDLSSEGIQSVVEQDVTSQRGNAMADAAARREAEATRRGEARERLSAEAIRRGELDRAVAADRHAGYFGTRPAREQQRARNDYIEQAMQFDRDKRAQEIAGMKDIEATKLAGERTIAKDRTDAELAAEQRQADMSSRTNMANYANKVRAELDAQGYTGAAKDAEFKIRMGEYAGPFPSDYKAPTYEAPKDVAGKLGVLGADVISGRVRVNPDAPAIDQARAIAKEAANRGIPYSEIGKFIKAQPGGIDLTDPVVAREQLNALTEEMRLHGQRVAGEGGWGGAVSANHLKGRNEIISKYQDILKTIAQTLSRDEVEDKLKGLPLWDAILYADAKDSKVSKGLAPLRGMLGE
jgi:hypothetical protein